MPMFTKVLSMINAELQRDQKYILNSIVLTLTVHWGQRFSPRAIMDMNLSDDLPSIYYCFRLLSQVDGFEVIITDECPIEIVLLVLHPYIHAVDESYGSYYEADTSILMNLREELHVRIAEAIPHTRVTSYAESLVTLATFILDQTIGIDSEISTDIEGSDDNENTFMKTPAIINVENALALSNDVVAQASEQFEKSIDVLRKSFHTNLQYMATVREIDLVCHLSQNEPRALNCIVAHVLDTIDGNLDGLRDVLCKYIAYTEPKVNSSCAICQSKSRDPSVLDCGHVLCKPCIDMPSFTKTRHPFSRPQVTCPTCKCEGFYTKLYV